MYLEEDGCIRSHGLLQGQLRPRMPQQLLPTKPTKSQVDQITQQQKDSTQHPYKTRTPRKEWTKVVVQAVYLPEIRRIPQRPVCPADCAIHGTAARTACGLLLVDVQVRRLFKTKVHAQEAKANNGYQDSNSAIAMKMFLHLPCNCARACEALRWGGVGGDEMRSGADRTTSRPPQNPSLPEPTATQVVLWEQTIRSLLVRT